MNRYRRQKRLVSLDETEEGTQYAAPTPAPRRRSIRDWSLRPTGAGRALIRRTVHAGRVLPGRSTLAEIARMLTVHESTISRKLDKLAKSLRKQILAGLGRRGLSRRQAGGARG